jgi:hypothetical protein
MFLAGSSIVSGELCMHPPPVPGFSNTLYQGRWYEVGTVREVYIGNCTVASPVHSWQVVRGTRRYSE